MSDPFMSSMTFASGAQSGGAGCDCDECGIAVPGPILRAMREHKRQKLETEPLKRTQERRLVCRQDGLAVWKWTLPLDAEPLIEFGSTHRLVWVENLPGTLRSVGTGIIGSSDEENTRKILEWDEGGIYLVPSNGGKAVAWIHSAGTKPAGSAAPKEDSKEESELQAQTAPTVPVRGHAILQIVKIPVDAISTANPATQVGWVYILLQICQNILEKNKDSVKAFYPFPDDCSAIVRRALQEAEEKSGSQAPVPRAYAAASIPEPTVFNPLLDGNADSDEKKRKAKDVA
jgi:hypothetical protein